MEPTVRSICKKADTKGGQERRVEKYQLVTDEAGHLAGDFLSLFTSGS